MNIHQHQLNKQIFIQIFFADLSQLFPKQRFKEKLQYYVRCIKWSFNLSQMINTLNIFKPPPFRIQLINKLEKFTGQHYHYIHDIVLQLVVSEFSYSTEPSQVGTQFLEERYETISKGKQVNKAYSNHKCSSCKHIKARDTSVIRLCKQPDWSGSKTVFWPVCYRVGTAQSQFICL